MRKRRGKRGQGSVFRQKGRRFWEIKFTVHGKTYRESSYSEVKEDAQKLLRDRMHETDKGVMVPSNLHKIRFVELAQAVIDDYRKNGRKTTEKQVKRFNLHILPIFAQRKVTSLTPADFVDYATMRLQQTYKKKTIEKPVQPGTVNRELELIKHALKLGQRQGRILYVPYVALLEENNIRQGFFEEREFRSLCRFLPSHAIPPVIFAFYTGWRMFSEILPLKWAQVDFHSGTIRLEAGTTKNKQARPIYMPRPVYEMLKQQRELTDELQKKCGIIIPFVFHREGEQMKGFRSAWKTACKKAGIIKTPHDFCRTGIRNLIRAGVQESIVMKMTGRKTRSIIDRYNIVSDRDLREGAEKLDLHFSSDKVTVKVTKQGNE